MPRLMPQLDVDFAKEVDKAVGLAKEAESMLFRSGGSEQRPRYEPLHHARLELIYELAYLKVFILWEMFLEESFLYYLCGRESSNHGVAKMMPTKSFSRSLKDAENAMLAGKDYFLWSNAGKVLKMVKKHVDNGRHEIVVSASRGPLEHYAAIRNRIAHGQPDAIQKFNNAVLALSGRRNYGSRAGRFLRDIDTGALPQRRWLDSIARALKAYANAVV
jgi:hypothetical protein